jgi:hypothetical protein
VIHVALRILRSPFRLEVRDHGEHLETADRLLAEVNERIARQRAIIQAASAKGPRSIEAKSLLQAFQASRRALEKHRQLVLDALANAGRPPPAG